METKQEKMVIRPEAFIGEVNYKLLEVREN